MQYKIRIKNQNILIKSENAALSHCYAARPVLNWLNSQQKVKKSLDYGCGKLRYTSALRKLSDEVTVVDSKVQISRLQTIHGIITSIEDFVRRKWNDVSVCSVEDFPSYEEKYDLIVCCNVLSAIPCKKEIRRTLKILNGRLSDNGRCLIVNQHRNSYFNTSRNKKDSFPHAYGWIQKGLRGYSYYGIIDTKALPKILLGSGLSISRIWIEGQSTFAECHSKR